MHRSVFILISGFLVILLMNGCTVRTYKVTRDRVDQDLDSGNRGYIQGSAPAADGSSRKKTRQIQKIEIELHPIKFGAAPESVSEASSVREPIPEPMVSEPVQTNFQPRGPVIPAAESKRKQVVMKEYTVKKNDTLQKISQKFFGTTKKWMMIYEANKDRLKSADSISPGQIIVIPVEKIEGIK